MKRLSINDFNFVQHRDLFIIPGVEICRKLGYKNPAHQAEQIWSRNHKILKSHSTILNLRTTDGKNREVRCYNEAGSRFFISKCHVPLADQITMDMIQAFIKLRDIAQQWNNDRVMGKQMRRALTDEIQAVLDGEPTDKQKFLYMNVSRLNMKTILGASPKDICEQHGVENARDACNSEQLSYLGTLEAAEAHYLRQNSCDRKTAYQKIKWLCQQFQQFQQLTV